MAKYIEDEVHIESPMDLEAELCKYNCKTEKELVALILDHKDKEENNV